MSFGMIMKPIFLHLLFAILIGSILANCNPPPPSPPPIIPVEFSGKEARAFSEVTIPQPNCGGTAEAENSLGYSHSIKYEIELVHGLVIDAKGEIGFAGTGVQLGAAVANEIGRTYGSEEIKYQSITVKAAAGTNMVHRIKQEEIWRIGTAVIKVGDSQMIAPFWFRHDFSVQLVESYDLEDCIIAGEEANGQQQPTLTPPTTQGLPPVESNAARSCREFGGNPIQNSAITMDHVNQWRRIGNTDRNGTGIVIYCVIHQTPGAIPFSQGQTVPANVVLTADLGINWQASHPGALERLVHDGGGWGVFLSLQDFIVQPAGDLSSPVGGEYWHIQDFNRVSDPTPTTGPNMTKTRIARFEVQEAVQKNRPDLSVAAGDIIRIEYLDGQWTGDGSHPGRTGGCGFTWHDPDPNRVWLFPPEQRGAALVGYIDSEPFFIGCRPVEITAARSGELFLGMSDCLGCYSDNVGQLYVSVSVRKR
jgi:hypothetical protein